MSNRKKLKPTHRTQNRKRRRRFRFNSKTALVYWTAGAAMILMLIDALFFLVIQRPSVWHWIVAVFIVGMGIEIARARLRAR